MQKINHYYVPPSGHIRENLRKKGQFWTPDWVAEAMVEYIFKDGGGTVFDPAVGAGAFFRATKVVAQEKNLPYLLTGMDIDPDTLQQASSYGLSKEDMQNVEVSDFISYSLNKRFSKIVANPPYIRHHQLPSLIKEKLKQLSVQSIGKVLDGRAGFHIYFFIHALTLLENNGRLAFIMPADTCEGKFAYDLWQWVSKKFCVDAVVTFSPQSSPFPTIDTNPIIFFIHNSLPKNKFIWAKWHQPQTDSFKLWVRSGFTQYASGEVEFYHRDLVEGIQTGLSRPPYTAPDSSYVLGDLVKVVRGVATGANDFFFLTEQQIKNLELPQQYFIPAVGRTRDIPTEEVTEETLATLHKKGRPTWLLALQGDALETYPQKLREYLLTGENLGLPEKPLISQRKPWYKTEFRPIPPFLFAYLGRRNSRFIRNIARITPLTSFLCIYPKYQESIFQEELWKILNHPDTVLNLNLIGKSYGNGAIKVEPRALEKLPIPNIFLNQLNAIFQNYFVEQEQLKINFVDILN